MLVDVDLDAAADAMGIVGKIVVTPVLWYAVPHVKRIVLTHVVWLVEEAVVIDAIILAPVVKMIVMELAV